MVAQQYAPTGLQTQQSLLFNGATDANHGKTPQEHSSHDLGMAFDIGIKPRSMPNGTMTPGLIAVAITTSGSPANFQMNQAPGNATPTGNQLSLPPGFNAGWNDVNAAWFVVQDLRTAYPVPSSTTAQTTSVRNANIPEGTDPNQPISATNPAVYRLPTGNWAGNLMNNQRDYFQ